MFANSLCKDSRDRGELFKKPRFTINTIGKVGVFPQTFDEITR